MRQALITIALSLILADQMLAHFGATPTAIVPPSFLADPLKLGVYDLAYPMFRLAMLIGALVVGLLFWVVIKRTRVGMVMRAGVDDGAMTSALGVNVQRVFAGAFFVGSALAGLGGVFAGTSLSLAPGQDQSFLVYALVVVIVGGMGSLGGAALGALLYGLVDQYSSAYLPAAYSNLSALLTFVLLAVVLAVRPTGLFGRAR
jgi:branched-chain amino acid transport system permease protein